MKTVRVYRFNPDGTYQYEQYLCQSADACTGGSEWGYLIVEGDRLTFLPQSDSIDGPRTFEFAVVPDEVGDWTLRFALPDHIDVFYHQG